MELFTLQARKQIAAEIRKKFDKCNGAVVHFDGKQLVSNRRKREMLAVVVTGNNSTEQLLSCSFIQNGTGRSVADQVFKSLKQWGLEHFVRGKSYDTTNVNSGEKNGAGVLLEKHLGRKLLDLPCRHHVYELVLMTAYKTVFKTSTTSPDDQVFKNFRDAWNGFNHENIARLETEDLDPKERSKLIDFCNGMLKNTYTRSDYEELLQLAIMCLDPDTRYDFKLPGAIHHARWMAKAIYGLKMHLFRHQFSPRDVSYDSLKRFVLFVLRIYLKGRLKYILAFPFKCVTNRNI